MRFKFALLRGRGARGVYNCKKAKKKFANHQRTSEKRGALSAMRRFEMPFEFEMRRFFYLTQTAK